MSKEIELQHILRNLNPKLATDRYVFCTLPKGKYGDLAHLNPIASFCEEEGLTLVLPEAEARTAGLAYSGVFCCITLGAVTSLEAVGLTALVSTALAQQQLSANVIAAYHHDHFFVPAARAQESLQVIRTLCLE